MLAKLVEGKDALSVGPGIGQSDDTRALMEWLIAEGAAPRRPLLIDADGLNVVAQIGAGALKRAARSGRPDAASGRGRTPARDEHGGGQRRPNRRGAAA